MPPYVWCLVAGFLLAVGSEKIVELTGGRNFVRRILSTLCPLLVVMGFAGAVLAKLFF